MSDTANSLLLTQYVRYHRQYNAHINFAEKREINHHKNVRNSRNFNAHTK